MTETLVQREREREREREHDKGDGGGETKEDKKAELIRQFQRQQQAAQLKFAEQKQQQQPQQTQQATPTASVSGGCADAAQQPSTTNSGGSVPFVPGGVGSVGQAKKQREIYVGNLAMGVVTPVMLRDLFNGALSQLVPVQFQMPGMLRLPVVSIQMDASGRFGFIEMLTEDLADAALHLDKVQLCGRSMNIGRPKGYIDRAIYTSMLQKKRQEQLDAGESIAGAPPMHLPAATQQLPSPSTTLPSPPQLSLPTFTNSMQPTTSLPSHTSSLSETTVNPPTSVQFPVVQPSMDATQNTDTDERATRSLLLENLVPLDELKTSSMRKEISEEVKEECCRFGVVQDLAIPYPSSDILPAPTLSKIYVDFDSKESAEKAFRKMNGRMFDGNKIKARYVESDEFERAKKGEWITVVS